MLLSPAVDEGRRRRRRGRGEGWEEGSVSGDGGPAGMQGEEYDTQSEAERGVEGSH